ncbi:protein SHORT HYPOCOTYL IN WHITE LIGHT 1 [Solanum lycopersicum]|uniref:Protein SHORT HYPOCOTYL IN WHITE LIGHT 1 n=1 Tax=Solanum lycopersicum TaxID=4081 RepID=A0A3Q7FC58_SOLLC|nr:protein SHORT HYPOCOTYL IN WHITE LIGHT 1 [Solanum lycopersicum]XP_010315170.1 protein SHORT HYPOCOTYL IN WHITE LIGHT 1 [Solanum lycopersicum]
MESTTKSLHFSLYKFYHSNSTSPLPQFNHLHFKFPPISTFRLQASRRISNFSQDGDDLIGDSRNWSRHRGSGNIVTGDPDEDEDDEDEEEEDRSLDLLVKFIQNVFKKLSRKARKAVRSVLPDSISSQLVSFSVNGVIILTFLWLSKAVLEVFCTLGSVLFASILLIRGVWTGISYLQNNGNLRTDDDDGRAWSGMQPTS